MPKKRFQIFLDEAQFDILHERAERENTTMAELVRFAIDQYIMPSDMQANIERKRKAWFTFEQNTTSFEGFVDNRTAFRKTFYEGYDAGWINFQTRHIAKIEE